MEMHKKTKIGIKNYTKWQKLEIVTKRTNLQMKFKKKNGEMSLPLNPRLNHAKIS